MFRFAKYVDSSSTLGPIAVFCMNPSSSKIFSIARQVPEKASNFTTTRINAEDSDKAYD